MGLRRGLSETQSNVPKGTRKRNPLAAIAADSISSAIARGCDRHLLRDWKAIVQACPNQVILHPAGNRRGRRADDARRDMTFIKIKVFDAGAEIIGYAVLNAATGRPTAIGHGRAGGPGWN